MKMLCILAFVLLAGSVLATSCYSSSDCADDEYCDSYGTCQPYFTTTTTTSGCCAPAAILALVSVGAVFLASKKA